MTTDIVATENAAASPDQRLAEARALIRDGAFDEALACLEDAAAHPAAMVEALSLMGVLAYKAGNYAMAIRCFSEVEGLPGASTDIPEVLAVLYCLAGRLTEALFYGKLAAAHQLDDRLLGELGTDFPRFQDAFMGIRERPLAKEGERQLRLGAPASAAEWFHQHLSLFQDDEGALDGLTRALLAQERPQAAIDHLFTLRGLAPNNSVYASRMGQAMTAVGEFDKGQAAHRSAIALSNGSAAAMAAALNDCAYAADEARWDKGRAAVARLRERLGPAQPERPPASGAMPLRVGYMMAGLENPDDISMIAEAVSRHDRSKVSPVGFGLGDLTAKRNTAFRNRFDNWLNIAELDVHTLKLMIFNEEVDVLVDVGGYNAPQFLEGFPLRLAPVQVAWLGSFLGPAAEGFDFHLRDARAAAIEPGGAKPWPVSGGLYAFAPPISTEPTPMPSETNGYVCFGADATLAEINAEVALAWSRILLAVPEANLLLFDRELRDPRNVDRLLSMFGLFGMSRRVDVVSATTRDEFCREIDVLLTPFPHARPFTAASALACGIPAIALDQPGHAAEDVATLLGRLDHAPTMLAAELDGYVAMAIAWAEDSKRRGDFRRTAGTVATKAAVFDFRRLTAELEAAYLDMRTAAAAF